jgi:hypothetical protein
LYCFPGPRLRGSDQAGSYDNLSVETGDVIGGSTGYWCRPLCVPRVSPPADRFVLQLNAGNDIAAPAGHAGPGLIEARVTAPGTIGKIVRFTIRAGDVPKERERCLLPGKKKPRNRCG